MAKSSVMLNLNVNLDPAKQAAPALDSASRKILIVEDNLDSRLLLSKLLRLSGYDVSTACDGNAGYEQASRDTPDLIVTDVNMPGSDGIEFVKRVRTDARLAATPIMVVTAYGSNIAQQARTAGADAALDKPFDFDRFLEAIKHLLARRALQPE
ncbi:MAG TPA: response regulator [Blastocatellia bacterium]